MSFVFFAASKDPAERLDYTLPVRLGGDSIVGSPTVEVVDAESLEVIPSDLVIGPVSTGAMTATIQGITFWVTGGSVGVYYIRFTFDTQSGRTLQRTMRLRVEQQ